MIFFFDARYIRTDFHDGVSRFSTELAAEVAKLTSVTFLISDERQRKFLPENAQCIRIHATTSWKEPFTSLVLNKYKPDVVFTPLQTMGSLGKRFKLIVTLHDLIYYRHRTPPRYLSPPIRALWWLYHLHFFPQRLVLNRADIVATVSETCKKEFEDERLTKRPIIVVHNAPRDLSSLVSKRYDVHKKPKHLFFMGSFMPYKNVETLIAGMAYLPEYTLHFLSKITPEHESRLKEVAPKGAKIVFHHGVSDEEYASLLVDQGLYVSASRAEGFGLPLAESLALGVPCVVSDLPIHREVADGGAVYFPADNPRAFAKAVRQLEDEKQREKAHISGKKHIQKFSWATSAKVLVEATRSL